MRFPLYCLCIGVTLALVVGGPGSMEAQFIRDPEAVSAYEAGLNHLAAEEWDQALTAFTQATTLDPTYAVAFQGLGDALRALEDYQSAINQYRQALDINPKLALAFNGRGVCYRELGEINLAANDFDNASQLDRKNPEIAANWGDILVNQLGDAERAIRYLDVAIAQDPHNAEAYRNRGLAHTLQQDFDEAVADLEKSLQVDPQDFETHATLATVYLYQEEYADAIGPLSRAIETYAPEESTDPEIYVTGLLQRADTRRRLALQDDTPAAQKQTLLAAAVADADQVLEEYPDRFPESGLALHRRGLALRLQGLFGEAIKALTDAIQVAPAGADASYLAEAYLKRGICWFYQQQGSLARGDLEQAANLNFEDPRPHLWMGFTHFQEGNYREAIDHYGEAIARNPAFPLAYVNRGIAYMRLGEFKKGVENFNEAIRHEPDGVTKARHFYRRGKAYLMLEDFQKAFDSFDHATLNDDSYREAFQQAAETLEQLGQPNLAAKYRERATALPDAKS